MTGRTHVWEERKFSCSWGHLTVPHVLAKKNIRVSSGQQKVKEQSLSRAINMKDIFSMTQIFSDIFTTQLFHYTSVNPKNHQKQTFLGGNLTLKRRVDGSYLLKPRRDMNFSMKSTPHGFSASHLMRCAWCHFALVIHENLGGEKNIYAIPKTNMAGWKSPFWIGDTSAHSW